ncbi:MULTISPECIES: hypothetical protein [Pseudomonas]|uniref:hypothetical protein n=1 Tax=Pseudomonas TaxID=286 RepID=UPI001112ECB9|nr:MULTISPECIES: hypothetical protein [Pseudomonas]MCL8303724.1 hypothetical protein [Pseudomonas putida]
MDVSLNDLIDLGKSALFDNVCGYINCQLIGCFLEVGICQWPTVGRGSKGHGTTYHLIEHGAIIRIYLTRGFQPIGGDCKILFKLQVTRGCLRLIDN